MASIRLGVTFFSCDMKPGNGPFRAGAGTLVFSVSVLCSSEHSGLCSQAYRMASSWKQNKEGKIKFKGQREKLPSLFSGWPPGDLWWHLIV